MGDEANGSPVFSKGRDLDATATVLGTWLADRLEVGEVTVDNLIYPTGAGVSNETILFDARWSTSSAQLVLRAAPSPDYQLFLDPGFRMQYDLLAALGRTGGVRVPEVMWFEDDPAVIGQPFFIMRRMRGRVPVSMPVYNKTGWLTEATPAQRRKAWESAMGQFAAIHTVPVEDVRFVDRWPEAHQTGAEQQLTYWTRFAAWALGDDVPEALTTLLDWLAANAPEEPAGLSWGDARIGNMMFGEDFEVVGVMDWEQASLAGAMADLGWWLTFDDLHSVDQGLIRLDGLGTRQETIDLWEELTGRRVTNLLWHEVFASTKAGLLALRSQRVRNIAAMRGDGRSPYLGKALRMLDLPVPAELS